MRAVGSGSSLYWSLYSFGTATGFERGKTYRYPTGDSPQGANCLGDCGPVTTVAQAVLAEEGLVHPQDRPEVDVDHAGPALGVGVREQLVSGEDFMRFVAESARFHRYSPQNRLLIACQLVDRGEPVGGVRRTQHAVAGEVVGDVGTEHRSDESFDAHIF